MYFYCLKTNYICTSHKATTIPANKAPSGNVPTTSPGGGQNVTSWKRGRNFLENKVPAANVPTTLAFGDKIWFKYYVVAT